MASDEIVLYAACLQAAATILSKTHSTSAAMEVAPEEAAKLYGRALDHLRRESPTGNISLRRLSQLSRY